MAVKDHQVGRAVYRLRAVPFFISDSRASEMRTHMKNHPTRERGDAAVSECFSLSSPRLAFFAWGDFDARSRFAPATIPEEKWGLLVV